MELDEDMTGEDIAEDMMMDLDYDSSESEHTIESVYDNSDSEDDGMSTFSESLYERLQNLLIAPERATVMTGLKELKSLAGEGVSSKFLPEIVGILRAFDASEDEDIQDIVGFILIDISAETHEEGQTIITAGAITPIAEKLRNRVEWMGPQAIEVKFVWCLMNLATDGEEFREILVANGINDTLIDIVHKAPPSHLLVISIAALSALQAEIPRELIRKRLPDVLQCMECPSNEDELDDVCRSLDYIVKQFLREQLPIPKSVMDKVPYLIGCLTHSYRHIQNSSNNVLNTIASGPDEACQILLDSNILDVLTKFLDDSSKRAQACTTISEFTAGNCRQIACVIEKGIMTKLINIVKNFGRDLRTWKSASCAIANALDGRRTPEQFRYLILGGAIEPLCDMLEIHSERFRTRGDEGHLKIKTTERLLRCLDQVTIHLPLLQGSDLVVVPNLVAKIEEIFMTPGYNTYQRELKNGIIPQPDSELEQMLTRAMKQFSLNIDPKTSIKKMNITKINKDDASYL